MKNPIDKGRLAIILIVIGVILIATAILLYYFLGVNKEVVATYDGGTVTRVEYETLYRRFGAQYYYYGCSVDQIDDEILNGIVVNEILTNKATKEGLTLTDSEKADIEEEFKSEDNLAQMASYGINVNELKKMYYSMMLSSKYLEKVQKATTTEQIKSYIISTEGEKPDYNIYKISMVQFNLTENSTDSEKSELLKQANKVLTRAKSGEDFSKLVTEFKEGTNSTASDVDMTNNDKYAKELRTAVLSIKAGKVYGSVVKTSAGYVVVKLNSIEKDGRLTSDTEINYYIDDIYNQYKGNANIKAKEARIKTLTDKFNVELGIVTNTSTSTSEE